MHSCLQHCDLWRSEAQRQQQYSVDELGSELILQDGCRPEGPVPLEPRNHGRFHHLVQLPALREAAETHRRLQLRPELLPLLPLPPRPLPGFQAVPARQDGPAGTRCAQAEHCEEVGAAVRAQPGSLRADRRDSSQAARRRPRGHQGGARAAGQQEQRAAALLGHQRRNRRHLLQGHERPLRRLPDQAAEGGALHADAQGSAAGELPVGSREGAAAFAESAGRARHLVHQQGQGLRHCLPREEERKEGGLPAVPGRAGRCGAGRGCRAGPGAVGADCGEAQGADVRQQQRNVRALLLQQAVQPVRGHPRVRGGRGHQRREGTAGAGAAAGSGLRARAQRGPPPDEEAQDHQRRARPRQHPPPQVRQAVQVIEGRSLAGGEAGQGQAQRHPANAAQVPSGAAGPEQLPRAGGGDAGEPDCVLGQHKERKEARGAVSGLLLRPPAEVQVAQGRRAAGDAPQVLPLRATDEDLRADHEAGLMMLYCLAGRAF